MEPTGENRRVRAWVLGRADNPEEAAPRLYEKLGHEGGDEFVVVRADVVDHHYNIVIPVDGASDEALQGAIDSIGSLGVLKEIDVLKVRMHVAHPPHIANGYISHAELAAQHDQHIDIGEYIKAGRQGASPGHNAWG